MAAAARGLKRALRWLPRSAAGASCREKEEDERNGLLLRSHRDRIVPVNDDELLPPPPPPLELLLGDAHLEPKTVALKVSMHCNGCARKVHKEISKLKGVMSIKVELEIKKVTVVGNLTPTDVLQAVSKVTKHAQIFVAPENKPGWGTRNGPILDEM